MEGVEVVLHQAAIPSVPQSMAEPLENHAANATGTLRVLEAARQAAGVRRVVYAASSAAYGETPALPKVETMPPAPSRPTAARSWPASILQVYARAYGLETVCLRYFNVFGPAAGSRSPSTRR